MDGDEPSVSPRFMLLQDCRQLREVDGRCLVIEVKFLGLRVSLILGPFSEAESRGTARLRMRSSQGSCRGSEIPFLLYP